MRRFASLLSVVVGLAFLAACGGDAAPMSGDAAAELHTRFVAVRTAVDARDADAAGRALDALRQSVERLRRDDGLTDERAADILGAAGAVDDQLVTITTTTTTTTTTLPKPAPAPVTKPGREPKPEKGGKGRD